MSDYQPKERRPVEHKDGMVTVSRKRLRAYPHKFDWNEARRRYEYGESISSIARHFGVAFDSVKRVVDVQTYDRMRRQQSARMAIGAGSCVDCGAPVSRNYSQPIKRCPTCAYAAKTGRP